MRRVVLLAVCAFALTAGGCIPFRGGPVKTKSFGLSVQPAANNETPVEVEFVMVRDEKVLASLLEMTSQDWFAKRAQIKSDHPRDIQTVSWEFVPGQTVTNRKLPLKRKKAKGLVVFANYFTPGPHRLRADPFKRLTLRLGESDFTIEESK